MDFKSFLGQVDQFGRDYPGLVAVAAVLAAVVVPIGWDLFKGLIAKLRSRPKPETNRLAGWWYGLGGWVKMMARRLATDSEALAENVRQVGSQNECLSKQLRASQKELGESKARVAALEQERSALANDLEEATEEVKRQGKALIRARGMDEKANQESFAKAHPVSVPQPSWLIKKEVFDGRLEFRNVGPGTATAVSVDTNHPAEATLVGAHFDAADLKFRSQFTIEPPRMREEPDLMYTVSYLDESGKHQTRTKKAAER